MIRHHAAVLACAGAAALSGARRRPPRRNGSRPPGDDAPLGDERLSDEWRVTRWAHAVARAPARSSPRAGGRRVATLRHRTEDGPLEVYLALESRVDGAGRTWIRIRLPMRPNGRTGWVPRDALGPLYSVRTSLRVNRRTLRATLYRDGRRVWRSPIGVGRRATPTPAGRFWIRTRLRNLGGGAVYGPWAFGTAAYSRLSDWPGGGVVGIHGTNRPALIPGRPSHGCVRVPNDRIRRLAELMPVGTQVQIL